MSTRLKTAGHMCITLFCLALILPSYSFAADPIGTDQWRAESNGGFNVWRTPGDRNAAYFNGGLLSVDTSTGDVYIDGVLQASDTLSDDARAAAGAIGSATVLENPDDPPGNDNSTPDPPVTPVPPPATTPPGTPTTPPVQPPAVNLNTLDGIIATLDSTDWQVRQAAIESLAYYANDPQRTRAVDTLIGSLNDPDSRVRQTAVRTLGYFVTYEVPTSKPEGTRTGDETVLRYDPRVIAALGQALDDPNFGVRYAAIDILATTPNRLAVQPLIKGLSDPDGGIRHRAVYALSNLPDARAVGALTTVLASDSWSSNRYWAAAALSKIGGVEAAAALSAALTDTDASVRLACAEGLGKIGNAASVAPLLRAVINDTDWRVRWTAEASMAKILRGDVSVASVTRAAGGNLDPSLREGLNNLIAQKQALRLDMNRQFGVRIADKPGEYFTLEELRYVYTTLSSFPAELLRRTGGFDLGKEDIFDRGGYYHTNTFSPADIILSNQFSDTPTSYIMYTFVHEFFHHIDYELFGHAAFANLHDRSRSSGDFPSEYGQTNREEDFAETGTLFMLDSKYEFLRAINQASNGQGVYLEKLLVMTNLFTTGHPDQTVFSQASGNSFTQVTMNVGRDSRGNITSIGGVSITDYNGLRNLFNNLF